MADYEHIPADSWYEYGHIERIQRPAVINMQIGSDNLGARMSAMAKTKQGKWESYRHLLENKRKELVDRLSKRRTQVTLDHDVDDEGALALQSVSRDLTMTSLEREIRTLAEVELSLRLLDSGQYGWCGSCGTEIPAARLRALPWTRICVDCAGGGSNPARSSS